MAKQDDQHLKLLLEILIEEFPQHEKELKEIKKHLLKLPIHFRVVLEAILTENNERWLNRMKGKY